MKRILPALLILVVLTCGLSSCGPGGVVLLIAAAGGGGDDDGSSSSNYNWRNVSNPGNAPTARYEYALAFSSFDNRTYLFGGSSGAGMFYQDLWAWDGTGWRHINITSGSEPSPRARARMVYNEDTHQLILFGGQYTDSGSTTTFYGDVWHFDFHTKTWINPSATGPVARETFAMTYDTANDQVIMCGGWDGGTPLNDIWVYGNSSGIWQWQQRYPSGYFPALSWHNMVWDSARQVAVVFGGWGGGGVPYSDIYEYDPNLNQWTSPTITSSIPAGRYAYGMAYDSKAGEAVIYAGYDGNQELGDTWFYNGSSWRSENGVSHDSGDLKRFGHRMVYVPHLSASHSVFAVFAGITGSSYLNDTLMIYKNKSDYSLYVACRTPYEGPRGRETAGMCYNHDWGELLIYGGWEGDSPRFNDLWTYDYTNWYKMNPSSPKPSGRSYNTMYYDSYNQLAVMFGGIDNAGNILNETWSYDPNNDQWSQSGSPTWPAARYGHSMVWVSTNTSIAGGFLFGGGNATSYMGDTWFYDAYMGYWNNLNPSNNPDPRDGAVLFYDQNNQVVFLFGGMNGTGYLNDMWVYDFTINTWSPITINGAWPQGRHHAAGCYFPKSNKMILFGGYDVSGDYLGTTWEYDSSLNKWRNVVNENNGPHPGKGLAWHNMDYDYFSNSLVLFGGYNGYWSSNEVWSLTYDD